MACSTVLLIAIGARAEAQLWPNEMWVNPDVGFGPPTDLREYFDEWASDAFVGVLENIARVIDGPIPY